ASSAVGCAVTLRRGDRLFLALDGCRLRRLQLRQQPCRGDLSRCHLHLNALQDLLDDVGMLLEEGRGVLAPLPETLVTEAEVRAGLGDDLPFERSVEHRALPRDPLAVDD